MEGNIRVTLSPNLVRVTLTMLDTVRLIWSYTTRTPFDSRLAACGLRLPGIYVHNRLINFQFPLLLFFCHTIP